MPGPLDCHGQFTLMAHTVSGNPARDNPPPFRQKIPQQTGILEIDRRLIQTKPAGTPALEQPPASATRPSLDVVVWKDSSGVSE